MHIHTSHVGLSIAAHGTSLAIGQFDGFHRGHRAVIARATAHGRRSGNAVGVLTFDPSPAQYFASAPQWLMSPAQRVQAATDLGIDHLFVLPFDAAMAGRTPQEFVDTILVDALGVRSVAVGADFRFGAGRQGDRDTLAVLGRRAGFEILIAELAHHNAERISSSRIRACIADGDMVSATQLLGRTWTIDGTVLRGRERGRTIGFPTANIDPGDYARPARGVYAVRARPETERKWYPAIANYGRAPTFGHRTTLLEVHIFDFHADLYGKQLTVGFCDYIRAERTFASADDLSAQIARDSKTAKTILDQHPRTPM